VGKAPHETLRALPGRLSLTAPRKKLDRQSFAFPALEVVGQTDSGSASGMTLFEV
jgi:hypothetical protein